MSKDSPKNIRWESDVRKGMEDLRNMKDIKKDLKDAADNRKIKGTDRGQ